MTRPTHTPECGVESVKIRIEGGLRRQEGGWTLDFDTTTMVAEPVEGDEASWHVGGGRITRIAVRGDLWWLIISSWKNLGSPDSKALWEDAGLVLSPSIKGDYPVIVVETDERSYGVFTSDEPADLLNVHPVQKNSADMEDEDYFVVKPVEKQVAMLDLRRFKDVFSVEEPGDRRQVIEDAILNAQDEATQRILSTVLSLLFCRRFYYQVSVLLGSITVSGTGEFSLRPWNPGSGPNEVFDDEEWWDDGEEWNDDEWPEAWLK